MASPRPISAIRRGRRRLDREIAVATRTVSLAGETRRQPARTTIQALYESAFLRTFTAWERFLESTFFEHLLRQDLPQKLSSNRYYNPPSRKAAYELLLGGQRYLDWTEPATIVARAQAVFKRGTPFRAPLDGNAALLREMKRIRNAIAHDSQGARDKFGKLVRS